jgi:hypothetical protein
MHGESKQPPADPKLEALIGKTIRCEGELEDYVLLASRCSIVDDER